MTTLPEVETIARLLEDNKRLRAALKAIEWIDDGEGNLRCPDCNRLEDDAHAPDCQLAAALEEPKEVRS